MKIPMRIFGDFYEIFNDNFYEDYYEDFYEECYGMSLGISLRITLGVTLYLLNMPRNELSKCFKISAKLNPPKLQKDLEFSTKKELNNFIYNRKEF